VGNGGETKLVQGLATVAFSRGVKGSQGGIEDEVAAVRACDTHRYIYARSTMISLA
jgi:hypothetical protein